VHRYHKSHIEIQRSKPNSETRSSGRKSLQNLRNASGAGCAGNQTLSKKINASQLGLKHAS